MGNWRCAVVWFLVVGFVGCGAKDVDSVTERKRERENRSEIERVAKIFAESKTAESEAGKWAAFWPIVIGNCTSQKVVQKETGNPITITRLLAASPYEWSMVSAVRETVGVPSTIDIETMFAVTEIPWAPLKEREVQILLNDKKSGAAGIIEVEYIVDHEEPQQTRVVSFRLIKP